MADERERIEVVFEELVESVKPSNVRIGLDGRARLLDFGLALSPTRARSTAPCRWR